MDVASAKMPIVPVMQIADGSEVSTALVRVSAWPVATCQLVGEARQALPWGQVLASAASCGSFGVGGYGEEMIAVVQKRTKLVDAARARTLARRQITHYKCMSCRVLVPNEDKKCANCGYTRAEDGTLALLQREKDRAQSRQNTRKGRRRNKCTSAIVPAHSLEVVPSSPFQREWSVQLAAKKQKVVQETGELAMARCGEDYVENEDSHACVFESFLQARVTRCKCSSSSGARRKQVSCDSWTQCDH